MDHTLENLIRSAAVQLEAAEPSEAQDFCGFRQRAAEMTDLFIEALFPRHAAAPILREDALRQAAELLDTCLRVVLPPSARPESVVREVEQNGVRFGLKRVYAVLIQYIAPLAILLILVLSIVGGKTFS